jgi:hypothetical protein
MSACNTRHKLIEAWLIEKHVSLWADWDVTDRKEREQAAEWFDREVRSFLEFTIQHQLGDDTLALIQKLPPPRPQDHESQRDSWGRGQINLGPTIAVAPDDWNTEYVLNDGLEAGGLQEFQIARDWAEGMNQ